MSGKPTKTKCRFKRQISRRGLKKIHRFLSLIAISLIYGRDLWRQKEVGKEHKRKHNNYNIFFDGEINGTSKNTDTKRD